MANLEYRDLQQTCEEKEKRHLYTWKIYTEKLLFLARYKYFTLWDIYSE